MYWNYRLGGLQSALGISQLNSLEKVISEKIKQGSYYLEILNEYKDLFSLPLKDIRSSKNHFWVFGVTINRENIRNKVINRLEEKGIETRPFFWPLHKQNFYSGNNSNLSLNVSENLGKNGLYIPLGSHINRKIQEEVVGKLVETTREFYRLNRLSNSIKYRFNKIKDVFRFFMNQIIPFQNYSISEPYGRLGNNLQQVSLGIMFAEKNNYNFYVQSDKYYNSFELLNRKNDHIFRFFKKKSRFYSFLDTEFEKVDKPLESLTQDYIEDHIQEIFLKYIKPNLKYFEQRDLPDDLLVIHLRSGDIFEKNKYPNMFKIHLFFTTN